VLVLISSSSSSSVMQVHGLLVHRAERVTSESTEAFIVRLYREQNQVSKIGEIGSSYTSWRLSSTPVHPSQLMSCVAAMARARTAFHHFTLKFRQPLHFIPFLIISSFFFFFFFFFVSFVWYAVNTPSPLPSLRSGSSRRSATTRNN